MSAETCSCGNRFDGDNLCMPSACQWEGIEPDRHEISENHCVRCGQHVSLAFGDCPGGVS